jgi:two-component system, NarL family, sensor histidine kinase DevS
VIPAPDTLDEQALRRLLGAGRALVSDLDVDGVLDRLLRAALDVTGARYAALGILDRRRERLERFVTLGIHDSVRGEIGEPPRGRGVLGALITDPRPLRLDSVSSDPRAYGFPPGHPPMETFLGVPVLIRGEAWGNLYLTEKPEPFTQADEDAIVVLAAWASVAIENARLYQDSERRRAELTAAVRRLEATTAIALAVGGETDLTRVLDLIARQGLELVGARGVAILLREEDGLHLAAEAGDLPSLPHGTPIEGGARASLGLASAGGVLVPLVFRGRSLGMLAAFGPQPGGEDERLLRGFAASAATAVATARTVEEQRLRGALEAAEAERTRWARELHDETLQGLGALRLLLVAARRSGDVEHVGGAVQRLEEEIDGLRGLIRDLRPAALDELGLGPAIEGLAERAERRGVVHVGTDVHLPAGRLSPEIEVGVYRVVQEALTNAVRHASARRVSIKLDVRDHALRADVHDDGDGFDPNAPANGFGLIGMRERVALLRGELEISSSAAGTHVSAAFPLSSARE